MCKGFNLVSFTPFHTNELDLNNSLSRLNVGHLCWSWGPYGQTQKATIFPPLATQMQASEQLAKLLIRICSFKGILASQRQQKNNFHKYISLKLLLPSKMSLLVLSLFSVLFLYLSFCSSLAVYRISAFPVRVVCLLLSERSDATVI